MILPPTIPIDDLKAHHGDYDPEKLQVYQALYEGGSSMEGVKEILLPQREVEKQVGPNGATGMQAYKERINRAPYTRRIAGFIDWMLAAMFAEVPHLEFDGLSEESQEYYLGLEENCDGKRTPMVQMMRDAALEGMVHQRSYLGVMFPKTSVKLTDATSMVGLMRLFRAKEVEDWEYDSDGTLHWLRWHGAEFLRDPKAAWKIPEKLRHVWAFISKDGTAMYEAEAKWPGNTFEGEEKDGKKVAKRFSETMYVGGLPIFEVRYRTGQWIMETCYDIVRAIFARDASIEHLGDKFAFQILLLSLRRATVKNVYLPDLGALMLQEGESASFIAPQQILDPLFKSADKLRRDLMDSIQASAQNAASIPQAGRLSGEAVSQMRQPLEVLLQSFAQPVIDAFQCAIDRLALLRKDPVGSVKIVGLNPAEVGPEDLAKVLSGSFESRIQGTDNARPV